MVVVSIASFVLPLEFIRLAALVLVGGVLFLMVLKFLLATVSLTRTEPLVFERNKLEERWYKRAVVGAKVGLGSVVFLIVFIIAWKHQGKLSDILSNF